MNSPKDQAGNKKAPLKYVPMSGLIHVAGPLAQGAEKYGSFNWRETPISLMGHLEAVFRHLIAYADGEDNASDSGYHHLAHAAATLFVILDAQDIGSCIDDRVAGPSGKLLTDWITHNRRGEEFHRTVSVSKVPAPEDKLPLYVHVRDNIYEPNKQR